MEDKIPLYIDIKSLSVVNGEMRYQYSQKDIEDIITTITNKKSTLQAATTELSNQISDLQQKLNALNNELISLNNTETSYQQILNMSKVE